MGRRRGYKNGLKLDEFYLPIAGLFDEDEAQRNMVTGEKISADNKLIFSYITSGDESTRQGQVADGQTDASWSMLNIPLDNMVFEVDFIRNTGRGHGHLFRFGIDTLTQTLAFALNQGGAATGNLGLFLMAGTTLTTQDNLNNATSIARIVNTVNNQWHTYKAKFTKKDIGFDITIWLNGIVQTQISANNTFPHNSKIIKFGMHQSTSNGANNARFRNLRIYNEDDKQ